MLKVYKVDRFLLETNPFSLLVITPLKCEKETPKAYYCNGQRLPKNCPSSAIRSDYKSAVEAVIEFSNDIMRVCEESIKRYEQRIEEQKQLVEKMKSIAL